MKQDIAKKWVEALRSGQYKQATEVLKRTIKDGIQIGHCCLGVLCELYTQDTGQACFKPNSFERIDEGEDEVLPYFVIEWAGMKSERGHLIINNQFTSLSEVNDNGMNFLEIADIISNNVEDL